MGLKYSKDAVKIGFADISNDQNVPSNESYMGYFPIDLKMSIDEQKDLLFTTSNKEKCFDEPIYIDDKKYNEIPTPPPTSTQDLPSSKALTLPPNKQNEDLKNIVTVAVGLVGAYLLIKLVA